MPTLHDAYLPLVFTGAVVAAVAWCWIKPELIMPFLSGLLIGFAAGGR